MLVDESHLALADDGAWHTSSALAAVEVPPTIAALLAARLDQLPPGERSLAERASVMGKSFEQAALAELVPAGRGALARDLLALVRKDLIRPDRSLLSAGDAYRFRHLLIRDAAYDALSKAERAELHARFGDWLSVSGDGLRSTKRSSATTSNRPTATTPSSGCRARSAQRWQRAAKRLASAVAALNISGSAAAITLWNERWGSKQSRAPSRAETLIALGEAISRAGRLAGAALHRRGSWLGFQRRERHHRGSGQGRPHERQLQLGSRWCVPRRQCRRGDCGRGETAGLHREAAKAYRLIAVMHFDGSQHDEALRFAELAIVQARLSQDRHQVAATSLSGSAVGQWTSASSCGDRGRRATLMEVEGSGIRGPSCSSTLSSCME